MAAMSGMRNPTVAPVAPASALAAGRRRPIDGDVSALPLRALELRAGDTIPPPCPIPLEAL